MIVRSGRSLHKFRFRCGYDLGYCEPSLEGFLGLFGGLLNAMGCTGDFNWGIWKAKVLESNRDDQQFQLLIEHDDNK